MEENKINKYSPKTEEYYQNKTENSIELPEGFVNKVMEKVKTEQTKKKNNIIKWVSAAAAFVIVAGAVIIAPKLIGNLAPKEAADDVYENFADQAGNRGEEDIEYSANVSDEPAEDIHRGPAIIPDSEKISEELDRENMNTRQVSIIRTLLFVFHEGHELNWYQFYNACIDGTAGDDTDAILTYAKDCLDAFEIFEMTKEASQAQEIISAIEGSGTN